RWILGHGWGISLVFYRVQGRFVSGNAVLLLVIFALVAAASAGVDLWPQANASPADDIVQSAANHTWYVRPVAPTGTYGREDGSSYANAFNGLTAAGRSGKGIIWGSGGV